MILRDGGIHRRANQHFNRARRLAQREQLKAWFSGRESHLLPFELIRAELREQNPTYKGLEQVPLSQIVGSVGRYQDFTRHFLPLSETLRDRWINVETAATARGWPPIDLYKIGEVYFVEDGNHRVAVAQQMGNDTIEAYVWQYPEPIHITPEDSLDEILIRLGERNFLAQTQLDQLYPDHQLHFTTPGRYKELLIHIEQLRRNLALIDQVEQFPYPEAVKFWYELVFLTTIDIINESGILAYFPGRTPADLFAWFLRHKNDLQEQYGEQYLGDLLTQAVEENHPSLLGRVSHKLWQWLGVTPDEPLDLEEDAETE